MAERIEGRLARQRVLDRTPEPLRFVALIAEQVLHDMVGGRAVMAEQLDHLLAMDQRPNIDIRVLPADGRAICARGGLELLTAAGNDHPFMVVTFDVDGPRYEERSHVIAPFQVMFEHLAEVALPAAESPPLHPTHQKEHHQ